MTYRFIRTTPLACVLLAVVPAAPTVGDVIFHDDFHTGAGPFQAEWSIAETGDQEMVWGMSGSEVWAQNLLNAGENDQTIIFAHPVDTSGYENISVEIFYRRDSNSCNFEQPDYIALRGYSNGFPGSSTLERWTHNVWGGSSQPPTSFTAFADPFEAYSRDNPNLWVAWQVNTSQDCERLYVAELTVTGTFIDCNNNGIPDGSDIAEGESEDCNTNGIPDECDIADGTSNDANANGIPDECECPADINGDGDVGPMDLAILLGHWGPCADPTDCPGDIAGDGDGLVGADDLAELLGNWGPCE